MTSSFTSVSQSNLLHFWWQGPSKYFLPVLFTISYVCITFCKWKNVHRTYYFFSSRVITFTKIKYLGQADRGKIFGLENRRKSSRLINYGIGLPFCIFLCQHWLTVLLYILLCQHWLTIPRTIMKALAYRSTCHYDSIGLSFYMLMLLRQHWLTVLQTVMTALAYRSPCYYDSIGWLFHVLLWQQWLTVLHTVMTMLLHNIKQHNINITWRNVTKRSCTQCKSSKRYSFQNVNVT